MILCRFVVPHLYPYICIVKKIKQHLSLDHFLFFFFLSKDKNTLSSKNTALSFRLNLNSFLILHFLFGVVIQFRWWWVLICQIFCRSNENKREKKEALFSFWWHKRKWKNRKTKQKKINNNDNKRNKTKKIIVIFSNKMITIGRDEK